MTGELANRISGSLQWVYESDHSGASGQVLTAYAHSLNISPLIHKFEGNLELEPSETNGYGALAITTFKGKNLEAHPLVRV